MATAVMSASARAAASASNTAHALRAAGAAPAGYWGNTSNLSGGMLPGMYPPAYGGYGGYGGKHAHLSLSTSMPPVQSQPWFTSLKPRNQEILTLMQTLVQFMEDIARRSVHFI